jgi:hypothetical protein
MSKSTDISWNESEAFKDKIAQLIIDHVRKNHCCRVGWACKYIFKTFPELNMRMVQENVFDKISAMVTESGEFIREPANINFPYDWNIRKTPAFRELSWTEKHPTLFEVFKALLTAALAIFVSYLISKYQIEQSAPKDNSKINSAMTLPTNTYLIIHDTVYIKATTNKQDKH